MRILVCGAGGQVGHELINRASGYGLEALGMTRDNLDITDAGQVADLVSRLKPGLIINAAAYTHVDNAETHSERAYSVNRDGAERLAHAARQASIPLLHISTDYVFSGNAQTPYREEDEVAPTGVYGASKLAGEAAIQAVLDEHIILRTSWVYGVHGHNFVKTMLRLGCQRDALSVVADQYGCPTQAGSIADALLELAQRYAQNGVLAWGLYHYSGRSPCTWFDFAVEVFRQAEAKGMLAARPKVSPISTAQYPTPARRPAWSVLDCSKFETTFGIETHDWHDDLSIVLDALAEAAAVAAAGAAQHTQA
ncbi:dTDP-4-dehydrorhamnose reductase [Pseudomonas sp. Choline-3u-10]|uniref:dTDP-4-dehydrorhamnose reductase n=1 Tax=Pseudomonadaceae TaxID=135621 RepID=UPI000617BBCC|nr:MULTISPECIES: dTDP-4-dehydrorhamnose reductase [Pseudomonadaceae]MBU0948292.1 dTDP-4-dehydrorhamnose reductase [Gammaproteobacteria bacterium]HBM10392.1 dTDP-4-dehydrorhamnose reductase [Pseudomonas sp.]KJJ61328.1 dTDP-4-dehydrorhamnose reductase [Pseudomonas sp. 10B238]MBK3793325.1 dTDP-4-dehydrorhamnose reductase [Stutzerimonas stutzeri]MBK3874813.1 dTDP-4-dehydrorhamnose reductase [Stutzerimonas stutzeri]|tara:strand:- start:970 stop:1896 length:927 start_codon:yes stop_codon:yes gene_type:complete